MSFDFRNIKKHANVTTDSLCDLTSCPAVRTVIMGLAATGNITVNINITCNVNITLHSAFNQGPSQAWLL